MGFRIVFASGRESGIGVRFLSVLWCSSGGLASGFRRTNGEPVSARVRFSFGEGKGFVFWGVGERGFSRGLMCLRSCETPTFRKTVERGD